MDAKDWLPVYADGEIQPVLQSVPVLDRRATTALVRRRLRKPRDGSRVVAGA